MPDKTIKPIAKEAVLDDNKLFVIQQLIDLVGDKMQFRDTMLQVCNLIPNGYRHPELVYVSVKCCEEIFCSTRFSETLWVEQNSFFTSQNKKGEISIYFDRQYVEHPDSDFLYKDSRFLQRITTLIAAIYTKERLNILEHENIERIKELRGISRTTEIFRNSETLSDALTNICSFLPEAWQYPDFTAAKIIFNDKEIKSKPFVETQWMQFANFETLDHKRGRIEIYYLKEFPEAYEGPFLFEERSLIDNLAALVSATANKDMLKQLLHDSAERLKELKGLNQTSAILKQSKNIDQAFETICQMLPQSWLHAEYAMARITYNAKSFTSQNFEETDWVQQQPFTTPDGKEGLIEIYYSQEFAVRDDGPFLKEEREMLINLADIIAESASRVTFNKLLAQNKERLKELKAINQTSQIISEGRSIDETLGEICNILPKSWQYPKQTVARIIFEEKEYVTPGFMETKWRQSENFTTIDYKNGVVEVFYLEEFPVIFEGPFLKEERNLLVNIAKLVSGYLNNYKGRELLNSKPAVSVYAGSKSEEFRKTLANPKRPLQSFFNQQVIDKYIYLDMMKYKVKDILFVATFYDAFILENEDTFFEKFMGEIYQYSLFSLPRITGVTSNDEAMEMLKTARFDLVILMVGIDSNTPVELSNSIKQVYPNMPIYLLLNKKNHLKSFEELVPNTRSIDKMFVWNGNAQIFFAIVKSIEDSANAENDTRIGLVRIILLIEDSAHYYSQYLQILYNIVFGQIQQLLPEVEKNELDKICKMRSRPKILHARNYEEATYIFSKYKDFMLCVISDVEFDKNGKADKLAGIKFIEYVKSQVSALPTILQSSDPTNSKLAKRVGSHFINKNSTHLYNELKSFLTNSIFFGDFVFKDKAGEQIAVAHSLREFETLFSKVPTESLLLHGQKNQFSLWLMSRGEIELARKVNPVKVTDFETIEAFRTFFLESIKRYKDEKKKGKILYFDETSILDEKNIVSYCGGSFGGKGRGLSFINALIYNSDFSKLNDKINIRTPITVIIGTNEFENFLERNHLNDKIFNSDISYVQLRQLFNDAHLSHSLIKKLEVFLDQITKPIAIRSSSLSEDSISQPFAGVFDTYIVPNNQKTKKQRLEMLITAIKMVYASVFSDDAKNYFKAIHHKIEEERMAVVLQELVGNQYENYYYPHISGTAQSYNYYPVANMKPSEGFAVAAVGLGFYVVGGSKAYRFSPKYPKVELYSTKDLLNSSQVDFLAVDLSRKNIDLVNNGEFASLASLDISVAEKHNTIRHSVSVYNIDNDRIEVGLGGYGPRIINFADILKYEYIPLAQTIESMLITIADAIGSPAEIEYAVDLNPSENNLPSFYLLQIKPLVSEQINNSVDLKNMDKSKAILYTESSLGNGIDESITDVIFIDNQKFDKMKTLEMVKEIEYLNGLMVKENRKYLLIGPGRWGTRDQYLGIPVTWSQISNARVIVEISLDNFPLDSSLGSHFFHNVTSMGIGYFSVLKHSSTDFIEWDVLNNQRVINHTQFFKHIRFIHPLQIQMDGKQKSSIITHF